MPVSYSQMREFQDRRVRIVVNDGDVFVATVLSATQDMDGSTHLIYDRVEWTNDPRKGAPDKRVAWHLEGEDIASIEQALEEGMPPLR